MAANPIECVFFDLDDCLYKNGWATMDKVTARAGEYCTTVLGLPPGRDFQLYKTYGTTVCGLVREGFLDEPRVQDFLNFVHDVPLEDVRPSPGLRAMLQAIPHKRWVFTASIRPHAERCLKLLGIEDLFLGIVSASSKEMIERVGYVSKHDPRCFTAAMDFAGVPRELATGCVLLDDSPSNLRTAKELGWRTVLVGLEAKSGSRVCCPHADAAVASLLDVRAAVPELFVRPDPDDGKLTPSGKRPRDEECSETESTSAGEDLEDGPSQTLKLGGKRRRLPMQRVVDGSQEANSSSDEPLRRVLRHYPSNSTDCSYEGFPATEEPCADTSSP